VTSLAQYRTKVDNLLFYGQRLIHTGSENGEIDTFSGFLKNKVGYQTRVGAAWWF